MTIRNIVAIDLGASSGRVMLGRYQSEDGGLTLREVSRFANQRLMVEGYDCWDVDALEAEIRAGLALLDSEGIVPDSIGIDTWGVDLVMIDDEGNRVGLPVSYRDKRTHGLMAKAERELGRQAIYQRTGIQFLPFNTLYQLRAFSDAHPEQAERVAHALLIPDYLSWRLTGQLNWEYTNATTTQLLNIDSGEWDEKLLQWAGARRDWFGSASQPGKRVGEWQNAQGIQVPVIAVASHDTASAILATPLSGDDSAYLSSGTWSLMGFESRQPCTGSSAMQANITNEGGAEGRYRVLKNIMGLWLLQRVCDELRIADLCQLIEEAAQLPACKSIINPNDERFINPASMVREIQDACAGQSMAIPQTACELARCIFDSLALLYRQVMGELTQLRGKSFSQLHIVGGGSQNHFLNQLCANACNLPVSAGPVEASTLGNIGCQLIALGELADVGQFRQRVVQNFPQHSVKPYHESAFTACWPRFQALSQPTKELCL
ncbi:rhamnulokinase [Winslowiella iniecta]|uniref:Rhamnulokinase n=1 Tax=Winslowiella iniecta TaxID=1560201 RepID=A0A0L7THW3_9GAMM|nr:rhamnulokinase [Winslowiella iniecta]KOC89268.1 rhamnulokinase [Winslowiella iniecta]KOC94836.1 rhamnulokinase [Winslowiella iniecta]